MSNFHRILRRSARLAHLWIGLTCGAFICLMGFTGGIVAFRPQIATLLSPAVNQSSRCIEPVDWNRVERQIDSFANSQINRIYFPNDSDPRHHIRMVTGKTAIYTHVIYDACTGSVLGTANLEWMDWIVDLHHNLLAGQTGRKFVGAIGVVMLLSAAFGLLLWLVSNPTWQHMYRIRRVSSAVTLRDLHRAGGLFAGPLLLLAAYSGLWLCFQQPMRAMLSWIAPVPAEVRVPRSELDSSATAKAKLGDIIAAAQKAIPNGSIREIRMPEGYGNVQIRMWKAGDFRSLGNNVVTVDNVTAQALAVDLYSGKPASSRFIQAMSGLHYGEWGGLAFRTIYGVAGFVGAALFVSGLLIWWLPQRRKSTPRVVRESQESETPQETSSVFS